MSGRAAAGRVLPLCGAALVVLVALGLATHRPGSADPGSDLRKALYVATVMVAIPVYALVVRRVCAAPPARRPLLLVLAVAAALRLVVLAGPPFMSSDLYRYIWDGRVQQAGRNPYADVPAAAALADLRDAAIYPHINRADVAPTIYPPAAQLVFRLVAALGGTPLIERLCMVGFECLTAAAVVALLDRAGLSRARLAIYAWNPQVVWEYAGNGHIDAAATAFVMLALLAAVGGRRALAGVALGAAFLVKLLPIAAAPVLWRRGDWRLPAALAALTVALYAPFLGVGWRVLGYLGGYAQEEGLQAGTGIWWLDVLAPMGRLPAWAGAAWLAAAAVALAALALRVVLRPAPGIPGRARDLVMLGTAVLAAITPHYPWYFAWLAAPGAIAPLASALWLSVAPVMQYHNPWHDTGLWFAFFYVPFLALVLRDVARSRSHAPS